MKLAVRSQQTLDALKYKLAHKSMVKLETRKLKKGVESFWNNKPVFDR